LMFAAKREEWRKAQVSREGKGKKGPEYSKLRRIGQHKRKRMQAVETTPHRIIKNSTIRNAQCAGMTCRRGRPLLGHTLNDDPRIAGRNVIVGDPREATKKLVCARQARHGAAGPNLECWAGRGKAWWRLGGSQSRSRRSLAWAREGECCQSVEARWEEFWGRDSRHPSWIESSAQNVREGSRGA
jgi:hypothetical protein